MNWLVHARKEIESCEWIPPDIQALLYKSSVAVNTLYTPFDETELIDAIGATSFPVRQIAYAHEVPPYFTRKNQYASPLGMDLDAWRENSDITQPWLYGCIRHPNHAVSIVLFIRWQVLDLSDPTRPRIDPKGIYIRGVFDQYRRLVAGILSKNWVAPVLRMVWALPGYAQRSYQKWKFQEYGKEVEMLKENNENSARFVIAATRQTLEKYWLTEANLLLLGASGTLGKVVSLSFPQSMKLDVRESDRFPTHGRYLVLDMTGWGSLEYYAHRLTPEIIWLNESFPPPLWGPITGWVKPGKLLHIQWVDGNIIPSFPYGYGDIPPCCMGLDDQEAKNVKILEMN